MPLLTTRELATAALFTAILAASAFVAIPAGSVPFTLQVYVVLLAGMVLGPRLGVLSVLAYLVLGLVSPVYAGGASGLGALFGPTGGICSPSSEPRSSLASSPERASSVCADS